MKNYISRFTFIFSLLFLCTACVSTVGTAPPVRMPSSAEIDEQAKTLTWQAKGLNPKVTRLALQAYYKARVRGVGSVHKLTVVDYAKPSTERRFWVFDLSTNRLLFQELVAHGKNSGQGKHATVFSDRDGSLQSSIGLYVTERRPYVGQWGYSLRLRGLDQGFNGNAAKRAIVVHGADYVSDAYVSKTGRLGLSWGCPALPKSVSGKVIDHIKGGSLIFAYYPDQRWLRQSQYLRS